MITFIVEGRPGVAIGYDVPEHHIPHIGDSACIELPPLHLFAVRERVFGTITGVHRDFSTKETIVSIRPTEQ